MAKVTRKMTISPKAKAARTVYATPTAKTSNADAKGRIVLGPKHANKMFRVTEQPDGNLLLEPVVAVHEREVWFYKSPEAQALVQEGIRQSREGKGKDLGSFAEFANDDIDEN